MRAEEVRESNYTGEMTAGRDLNTRGPGYDVRIKAVGIQ